VVVQGGAYGEHLIDSVHEGTQSRAIGGRHFTLRLEPGCGGYLELTMRRYAGKPTLAFPWA
jgi:hypothetical protein